MRTILLLAIVTYFAPALSAHNPLTAKFELIAGQEQNAVLHVYLSQTGLHQALSKHYAPLDLTTVSPKEYKTFAIRYVKDHISIKVEQQTLTLGAGGIKLGSHQTDFKFLIPNYPAGAQDLNVSIDALAENEGHHSVFWWSRGSERTKVILSSANDFQRAFSPAVPISERTVLSRLSLSFIVAGALTVLLILMVRTLTTNAKSHNTTTA